MLRKKYEMVCDLCKKSDDLKASAVSGATNEALEKGWYVDKNVAICQICRKKISG